MYVMLMAMCLKAHAQNTSKIDCDFAQLNLQIDSVSVVEQINSVNAHITAQTGQKLFIVYLKATSKVPSIMHKSSIYL